MPFSVSVPGFPEEIEFPDGTDPGVMKSVIQKRLAAHKPIGQAATLERPTAASRQSLAETERIQEGVKPSWWQNALNERVNFIGGTLENVAALPALALDASRMASPQGLAEAMQRTGTEGIRGMIPATSAVTEGFDRGIGALRRGIGITPEMDAEVPSMLARTLGGMADITPGIGLGSDLARAGAKTLKAVVPDVAKAATKATPLPAEVAPALEQIVEEAPAVAAKMDPIAHKQVRQFIKKNGITDRAAKDQLFAGGLTPEQKETLITKKLPPVKEVGMSRFYTTTPDKMRDDLGEAGVKAWRALDERNYLHETRQVRDERTVKALTKGWSEQDNIDAFDYIQRAKYGMDPAREATIRPQVRAAADQIALLFKRQAGEISEAGIKVPVDSPEGREWMEFVPIEEGYAPWYRTTDVDAPGLTGRFRLPDASRTRIMARDEAIAPEELDRHLGRAALRYFDETNELIATAKVFGNHPAKTIDAFGEAAIAEGKDGRYIREALDLALNGGPTKSRFEQNLVQKLSQATVSLTLPFSGPAQLGQLGPVMTKGGVVNLLRGMGTMLKATTRAGADVRDALARSAVTFESAAKGLHEGRKAKGFLGKMSAATLSHPAGVTPLDRVSRYISGAVGKHYADDLAKIVRGEGTAWYDDLKMAPEVAARELGQMGIDPKRIAAGEALTEDDYTRVMWHFAGDTNLRQRPEYQSIVFQRSPWGKLVGILTRFGMQQYPQFKREVLRPLIQQKRIGPALRWATATPALGYVNKKFGDMVYNRDTDDETLLSNLAEMYAAGALGMIYQVALAARYGFEGVFTGAALGKVADAVNIGGRYASGVVGGAHDAIMEGDPGYLTDALRKPVDDAAEGKGALIELAKMHPVGNAAIRHAKDPDRSVILSPENLIKR